MQGKITAVPVGQPEMVVFVGKEQRLVAGLAQGQQGCVAVAADRRPDAREIVRLTVRTPVQALEQVVRGNLRAADGEGGMTVAQQQGSHSSRPISMVGTPRTTAHLRAKLQPSISLARRAAGWSSSAA